METKKTDRIWLWIIVTFAFLLLTITFWRLILAKPADATTKVTICHNNGQSGNWSTLIVDWHAVNGSGSTDHNRSSHQRGRDIIPPGFWDSNGRNWTTEGQAVWNNDCNVPKPTPTPIPTKPPKPTPPPPPICEQEAWSCEACQHNPSQYQERLGACFEPYMNFCNQNFGCKFIEGCESKSLEECKSDWLCEDTCQPDPTPTPTPAPPPEDPPTGCTENCSPKAPQCDANAVVMEPANFHVFRKGSEAILRWIPTDGNKVHAYWKHPSASEWQHATTGDNTGYMLISDLGSDDWTFGLEQVNDCGGGVISSGRMMEVVDGNTSSWILFR